VLDFHGFTSNAIQQRGISGMAAISDREGFLLVHPDGVNNAWNAGMCCPGAAPDDLEFVRAVVAAVSSQANVDASRVYATGLSNGGAMSQRLACDAADLFAASAPMAFPVPFKPLSQCHPVRPMPVLTFMGLVDVLVAYDGLVFPSAAATQDYWHDVNGCDGVTPDAVVVHGASRCETFTSCRDGVESGLCSITAATFGGSPFDGHILYVNDDFVLSEVAWAFSRASACPRSRPRSAPARSPARSVSSGAARRRARRTRRGRSGSATTRGGRRTRRAAVRRRVHGERAVGSSSSRPTRRRASRPRSPSSSASKPRA
jgi:polyhydroxybutyrate depolymerase